MKCFILWGGISLLILTTQCLAQEREVAIYSVYPSIGITTENQEWNITLPEQPTMTIESSIEKIGISSGAFSAATMAVDHVGRVSYYETGKEEPILWGYKEAQVVHAFESPVLKIKSLWEQTFSSSQITFFHTRDYDIQSVFIGKVFLNVGVHKAEVSLIKSSEQITEKALKPYRKIRVSYYFLDDNSSLPLFQTVTDTLYTNEGKDKRVINFSLYRKEVATGIKNNSEQYTLQVYPNPTKGELFIENRGMDSSIVEIYDFAGRLQKTVQLKDGHNEISISHLSSGAYMLKYISKKCCNSIKLIKL